MLSVEVLKYIWNHPANRGRRLRAVGRSVGWQLEKRLTGQSRDIRVFGDLRLRCYPDSRGAGMMIYADGWYDYDDMHFVRRYLRPGDAVIDVGANIGVYTLLAASVVGVEGRVVAYEPGRETFERLRENVAINGLTHVDLRRAAIGQTRGTVSFHQKQDVTNRIAVAGDATDPAGDLEEVPCLTLDEELAGSQFALGKIDIEGAELMAFRGGRRLLREGNPPVWLLELKDRLLRRYGGSARELAELLQEAGYELATYDADRVELSMLARPWQYDGNALAIHRSAADTVRSRLAE
jgi:FkbM family methyltransferase